MDCDRAREAVSAQIDGEDPALPSDALTAHLANCAACTQWQGRAHTVTRRVRLGGSFLDHDLTAVVLAAVPAAGPARPRLRLGLRGGLIALALAQFAIAAPMLFLGHDHDAGAHAAHELGSFNLALAIAFAVGAVRPALSAGLAWPCGIAATGLVTTAIIDLIGGQAIGADEAQHLIALAGAALLVWQSRLGDVGSAGRAARPTADPAATGLAGTLMDAAARFGDRPDHPWGGAARVTAATVAARAMPGQAMPGQARHGQDVPGQSVKAGQARDEARDEEVA
jgi:predicted anti-sigma-YlaC factor YlaD